MTTPLAPGDKIHFLAATTLLRGLDLASSMNPIECRRGTVLEVDEMLLLANRDKNGDSILDLVDDPAEQVARRGKVIVGRGNWPAGVPTWEPNSPEQIEAHKAALATAAEISDPVERKKEFERVRRIHGEYKSSHSLGWFGNPADHRENIQPNMGLL